MPDLDYAFHAGELTRLEGQLDAAFAASRLPEAGPMEELNEFLVSERLEK